MKPTRFLARLRRRGYHRRAAASKPRPGARRRAIFAGPSTPMKRHAAGADQLGRHEERHLVGQPGGEEGAVHLAAALDEQRQDARAARARRAARSGRRAVLARQPHDLGARASRAAAPAPRRRRWCRRRARPAAPARRAAPSAARRGSRACGSCPRPDGSRVVSAGSSSAHRVGADQDGVGTSRMRCASSRDSSPETHLASPPRAASRPSSVTAALSVTHGRFSASHMQVRPVDGAARRRRARRSSTAMPARLQLLQTRRRPRAGSGSFMPTTTRATLASISRRCTAACAREIRAARASRTPSPAARATSSLRSAATSRVIAARRCLCQPRRQHAPVAHDHAADERIGRGAPARPQRQPQRLAHERLVSARRCFERAADPPRVPAALERRLQPHAQRLFGHRLRRSAARRSRARWRRCAAATAAPPSAPAPAPRARPRPCWPRSRCRCPSRTPHTPRPPRRRAPPRAAPTAAPNVG